MNRALDAREDRFWEAIAGIVKRRGAGTEEYVGLGRRCLFIFHDELTREDARAVCTALEEHGRRWHVALMTQAFDKGLVLSAPYRRR